MANPTPAPFRAATTQQPRLFRGVYDSDAQDPPIAPHGAVAAIVKDSEGRTIAFAWVVAEHADDFANRCWDWLDERDRPPFPAPELRIIR